MPEEEFEERDMDEFAQELTLTAMENNLIEKQESPQSTAQNIIEFYEHVRKGLGDDNETGCG